MNNRLRSLAANLSLLVASLVFFLVLGEIALQVGLPIFKPRFTRIDPVVGWFHTPSAKNDEEIEGHQYSLSYNSHGYRPHEHEYAKPAGTRRVIVLGDSFVDASEVGDNETFTWLLQEELPGVEVINLGVYGYSTGQELITLEDRGFRYDPDLVLLVTMTNDYDDNLLNIASFGPIPRFVLDGDSIALEKTGHENAMATFRKTNLPLPGIRFFHQHSLLYYFLNHYVYQRLAGGRIESIIEEQRHAIAGDEKRELYARIVCRMSDICEARGTALRVLFVYPEAHLEGEIDSPSRRVIETLESRGVATFDLHGPLRERQLSSDPSLYYEHDFHWNRTGHRFVTDLLAREIPAWLPEN